MLSCSFFAERAGVESIYIYILYITIFIKYFTIYYNCLIIYLK